VTQTATAGSGTDSAPADSPLPVDQGSRETREHYAARLETVAWVATVLMVIIPCTVLVGWEIGSERLKRILLGLVEMNPVVATLMIAAAISLTLTRIKDRRPWMGHVARALAVLMIVVGAIKIQGFFTGWDGAIDQLIFYHRINHPGNPHPNRMAPNTASSMVLSGMALLLIHAHSRRGWRPSQGLALAAGAASLLALLGYTFGAKSLYIVGAFYPMALHTAACFILLCVAILCSYPRVGVMRLVISDSPGGAMLRRLFPAAFFVPLLLALLRLIGLQLQWFDPELGVAILVVMTMAAFGLLAWINAKSLERSEALRYQADVALNTERNLLRRLIDNLPDHIFIKDAQGRYITDNIAHAKFVGLSSPEQIAGKTSHDLFPPELAAKYAQDDRTVLESRHEITSREEPIVDRKGRPMWIATTKVPLHDPNGQVTGLVCISRDITQRRKVEQDMLELQNFLFSIIENIPNMVFVKDAVELRFVRFNSAGEELLGFAREELLGKNDYDMFPKEEADFFTAKDRAVLRERKLMDIPAEPVMTRHGERILHTKKIPILVNGEARYLLGISEDITDRVAAEAQMREQNVKLMEMARAEREASDALKKAQSQMLQTEKLAALGQLVAGVAHEINNPLSFVSNNVAVLQRDLAAIRKVLEMYRSGDPVLESANPQLLSEIRAEAEAIDLAYALGNLDELMHRSRDGLKRIQNIVKDLRDFARLDESDLQEADLNHGIESTVNIVRGRAKGKQVELQLDLQKLPMVVCYPARSIRW